VSVFPANTVHKWLAKNCIRSYRYGYGREFPKTVPDKQRIEIRRIFVCTVWANPAHNFSQKKVYLQLSHKVSEPAGKDLALSLPAVGLAQITPLAT
jgi:hypothetical protein